MAPKARKTKKVLRITITGEIDVDVTSLDTIEDSLDTLKEVTTVITNYGKVLASEVKLVEVSDD